MTQPDVRLFSYGTLQRENVQLSCFGHRLKGSRDAMPGYRKELVDIIDPEVPGASGERFHPVVMLREKSGAQYF